MSLADESFYNFRESCVFYKGTDGAAIADFIHRNVSGIAVLKELQNYQYSIRIKQAKKSRRCKRDADIVEKMKKRSRLPPQTWHTGLTKMSCRTICFIRMTGTSQQRRFLYLLREVFCDKKPKTGKIFVCPQCKQKAIAKAQGRRAAYHEDRETCQVIQKNQR